MFATQAELRNLRDNVALLAKVVREHGDVIKVIVAALQPPPTESEAAPIVPEALTAEVPSTEVPVVIAH